MALSVARLLPGQGLDLSYIDDRALDGNPLRGADNVRVVDGEWWTREGTTPIRGVVGGGPFSYVLSIDLMYDNNAVRRHFAIGQASVIEFERDNAGLFNETIPYVPSWSGVVSFTNNNAVATINSTITGNVQHVDLLYGYDSDGVSRVVYGVTPNAGGTQFTLTGAYRGPTAANTASFGFVSPMRDSSGGRQSLHRPAFCVFRQNVTYAVGAVWGSSASATAPLFMERSPALAAGGLYLVWSTGRNNGTLGARGPVLIRLDAMEQIKGEFMRQTQSSFTSAVSFSSGDPTRHLATHRDRLIVVRADENGTNNDRTIWYSAPGDLMRWHTGTAGGSPAATHNNIKLTEGQDPITALMPLGSSLVVHRTMSQTMLTPTGSASFPPGPYTIEHNHQGLGCQSKLALVSVRGMHIFLSQYGPTQFDGQRCYPLEAALTRAIAQLGGTAEWVNDEHYISSLQMVYHAARQNLWFSVSNAGARDSWEGREGRKYLVYDLERKNIELHTFPITFSSIGTLRWENNSEVVVGFIEDSQRYPMVQLTQTGATYDAAVPGPTTTIFSTPKDSFQSYVETKWHNFGTETEKEIVKLELDLRVLSTSSTYQNEVVADLATSAFKYMLEIHTDLDLSTFAVQQVVTVTPTDLTGQSAYSEGRRMVPRVIVVPKVRVQGNLFKFRIRNFGSGISLSQPFRVSQIQVFYEDREATRREKRP